MLEEIEGDQGIKKVKRLIIAFICFYVLIIACCVYLTFYFKLYYQMAALIIIIYAGYFVLKAKGKI